MLKRHRLVLALLFGICTLIYYFGELVNFAGWQALHWEFFYEVHDTHRLFFLAPIIYAGLFFGPKGAIIISLASLITFLPRAIFISPFPDPIFRAVIYALVSGAIGTVIAIVHTRWSVTDGISSQMGKGRFNNSGVRKEAGNEGFIIGDIEIDLTKRLVKRYGQTIKLTKTEYDLLAYLVGNRGKVLTHEELLRNVWGSEYERENEYLRTFIRQLRRKIEDDPANPKLIVTETGTGYRFVDGPEHITDNRR